jgi:hypothetical protein
MTKRIHAKFSKIGVRQIGQERKIDVVLGESRAVTAESEPLAQVRAIASRPSHSN